MSSTDRSSIYSFFIYLIVISLGFTCTGCSPKSDDAQKDNQTQGSSEGEVRQLKRENEELKAAIADIHTFKEDVNRLKLENEDLKTDITEIITAILTFKEDVKRLKLENEYLKRAKAEILTLKEELARLKQENLGPRGVVAEATDKEDQSKTYYEYRDKYKEKTNALIARLDSAVSAEDKLEFIESLSGLSFAQDPSVIGVVQKALADPNVKVVRAAIELLEDYETPEILPVMQQALSSDDELTRIAALTPLSGINHPLVAELLAQALSDTSERVRAAAIGVAEEHEDPVIKLSVMERGIISPYDDVQYAAVSMSEERSDHRAIEILIKGLRDTDPDFHDKLNEAFDFLIEKEFETYEEAQAWWIANKDNYDNELFMIEDK